MGLETDNQSKVPQFLPGSLSFQNGGHRKPERCVTEGDFMGKIDLECQFIRNIEIS